MAKLVRQEINNLNCSVANPRHFSTDADPDPRIRTVPLTNGSGCGFGTLVHINHSSKIKSHKEVTKQ